MLSSIDNVIGIVSESIAAPLIEFSEVYPADSRTNHHYDSETLTFKDEAGLGSICMFGTLRQPTLFHITGGLWGPRLLHDAEFFNQAFASAPVEISPRAKP